MCPVSGITVLLQGLNYRNENKYFEAMLTIQIVGNQFDAGEHVGGFRFFVKELRHTASLVLRSDRQSLT
jgi:hypothetical protein